MSDISQYSTMSAKDLELFHYGVKGMQWGVRRPEGSNGLVVKNTPKDSGPTRKEKRTAKREKRASLLETRAGKFDTTAKELSAELNSLPRDVKSQIKRIQLKSNIRENTAARDANLKDAKSIRKTGLSRNQKLLIAGGVAAAAVGGFYAYSVLSESGQLNSMTLRGKAFVQGKDSIFTKNSNFARKDLSPDDVLSNIVKGTNPLYKTPGGGMNCRRASMAYELRRRGYDVTATASPLGWGQSESGLINAVTPGSRNVNRSTSIMEGVQNGLGIRALAKGDKRTSPVNTKNITDAWDYKNIAKSLAGEPDGARGEMLFNFGSFGHSMSYEIFNGKPVIFDAQKANKYDVTDEGFIKLVTKWGQPTDAAATRLDNIPLDMNFVSRWATNTKKG